MHTVSGHDILSAALTALSQGRVGGLPHGLRGQCNRSLSLPAKWVPRRAVPCVTLALDYACRSCQHSRSKRANDRWQLVYGLGILVYPPGTAFLPIAHDSIMRSSPLHCIALQCTTLHCTTLHYNALHYTTISVPTHSAILLSVPQCTTLHYTTVHYTALLTLH